MKALSGITLAVVFCLGCTDRKSGNNPGTSTPGGVPPAASFTPNGGTPNGNANPGGPLWVVLSNFRTTSKGVAMEMSVDYRVVSGHNSGQFVVRIQQPFAGGLVKYVDLPVSSSGQGTVRANVGVDFGIGSNCVAIFGYNEIGSDFKAYSGSLSNGGPPTSSQPPSPPANLAGGPGNRQPGQNPPPGFNPPGATPGGYTPPGYTPPGYNRPGYNRPGYTPPGSNRPGYPRPGIQPPGSQPPRTRYPGRQQPGLQPSGALPPGAQRPSGRFP